MLTPLALFVTLLLVTAFIAHWSDNLGKKLGKKRVSVLGFRPRTSATILTVASSWGIMIFTLFALLIAVAPLRHALFRYDSERARFAQEREKFEEQRKQAAQRLLISQQDTQKANQRREDAEKGAKVAQTQAIGFRNEARDARKEAQNARQQAQNAQREFNAARESERRAQRAAQAAQNRQKQALATLATARRKLAISQNQLSRTQDDLTQGKIAVTQANLDVNRAKSDARKAAADLREKRAEVEKAQATLVKTQKLAIKVGQDFVAQLERNAIIEKSAAATIDGILSDFAFRDIQLPIDQTLAERRIDAGQNSMQVEKELRTLLIAARQAMKIVLPGAKLMAGDVVPGNDSEESVQLSEVQTVQLYGRLLAKANRSVSARVVPIANYPANTSEVLVRFVFVPIHTIYLARQNIATGTIDTSKSESAIFGQLQKLVDEARYKAVKNDANPPLSPDDKNFFDGDTGQKLFEALHQLQKIEHPVEVRIVAARDLDSAEPLQIRFVVGDQAE